MFIHTHEDRIYPTWTVAAFSRSTPNVNEIREWCYNAYGHPGYEQGWIDMFTYGEVIFQREEDLQLFLLRWS